jgi:hypothetical protein
MVEQVKQRTGRTPKNWLVDGGYFNHEQMTDLARAGIVPYCPPHATHKGDRDPAQALKGDTPELAGLRERMASEAGQALITSGRAGSSGSTSDTVRATGDKCCCAAWSRSARRHDGRPWRTI